MIALGSALALSAACAGPPGASDPPPASGGPTCDPHVDPTLPEEGLIEAHARARQQAAKLGQRDAAAYIERRTRDGYRLRRLGSTLTMAAGFTLVGALLAALLLPLLGRRPPVRYGRPLATAVLAETAAIRALGAERGDSPAPDHVVRLFFRFADRLDATDRLAERLADLCEPVEPRADSELATRKLDGLYDRLERLLDAVEVLHVLALGWRERLARGPDPEVEPRAVARLGELGDLLEELA